MTSTIRNKISALRKAAGLSQQDLADRLGVHWVTISKLERGKIRLTSEYVARLAGGLGVDPLDIWETTVDRKITVAGTLKKGIADIRASEYDAWLQMGVYETIWFALNDDALEPFFFEGDILGFTAVANAKQGAIIGRLGLIQLDEDQMLLGTLLEFSASHTLRVRHTNGTSASYESVKKVYSLSGFHPTWSVSQSKPK